MIVGAMRDTRTARISNLLSSAIQQSLQLRVAAELLCVESSVPAMGEPRWSSSSSKRSCPLMTTTRAITRAVRPVETRKKPTQVYCVPGSRERECRW